MILTPFTDTIAAGRSRQMSPVDGLSHDSAEGSGHLTLQTTIRLSGSEMAMGAVVDDGRYRSTPTSIVENTSLPRPQSEVSPLDGADGQFDTVTRSSGPDSLTVPTQAETSVLPTPSASIPRFISSTKANVEESAVVSETPSVLIGNTTLLTSAALSATALSTQTPFRESGASVTITESNPPISTVPDDAGQMTTLTPSPATIFSGMGMNVETGWVSVSSAANNRAAAKNPPSEADGIFVPGHKLFPLGITVIVLGGTFILFTLAILLIRLCGWNRKRRMRRALLSFIEVEPHSYDATTADPMFEPKFETITTNMARTDPFIQPSAQYVRDERLGRRSSQGGGYAGVGTHGAYQVHLQNQPYSDPTTWDVSYEVMSRRPASPPNEYSVNPFLHPPRSTGPLGVPVDVDAGSPVPSFATGRMGYVDNPSYNDTAGIHHTHIGDELAYNGPRGVGRSLTASSNSSDRSHRLNYSARRGPPQRTGVPPQVSQYAGTTRYARRSNGSIGSIGQDSVYSNSSSEFERVLLDPRVAPPLATGSIPIRKPAGESFAIPGRKLEKPAAWSSSRL